MGRVALQTRETQTQETQRTGGAPGQASDSFPSPRLQPRSPSQPRATAPRPEAAAVSPGSSVVFGQPSSAVVKWQGHGVMSY